VGELEEIHLDRMLSLNATARSGRLGASEGTTQSTEEAAKLRVDDGDSLDLGLSQIRPSAERMRASVRSRWTH
jgi:hypothetical protein